MSLQETCVEVGCAGERLPGGEHCLQHAPDDLLTAEVERLQEPGNALNARRVHFTEDRLQALLARLRVASGGSPELPKAYFSDARFEGKAPFMGVHFLGDVWFADATFVNSAVFNGCRFAGNASFARATFHDLADFAGAIFDGYVGFHAAEFQGTCNFSSTHVAGDDDLDFHLATFSDEVRLPHARVRSSGLFTQTQFRRRVVLGPITVGQSIRFDDADFEQDVELQVRAAGLFCQRTRFGGRAEISVDSADLVLDQAGFGGSQGSYIAGISRRRPRVISMRRARVEGLMLGNVDLHSCLFYGAHGLDRMIIQSDCMFGQPPRGWRHRHVARREYDWLYSRRRTLAEEHTWRTSSHARNGGPALDPSGGGSDYPVTTWDAGATDARGVLDNPPEDLSAAQVASVYRALRKALEDAKDEPGAADFYYGEMELRRRSSTMGERPAQRLASRGERVVITLYWLFSGYGLRASRAIAGLVVAVALLALPLHFWGFRPIAPYGRTLVYAAQSSVSLFRAPASPGHETVSGQITEMLLRLAGPLFFGLALLSVRGRVKR